MYLSTASIFAGARVVFAGSSAAFKTSPLPPLVSLRRANTLPMAPASSFSSPIPPTCMNITLGVSQKKWLCSAVTSRPASSAALITGFT